jgi:hypothetical protein
MDIWVLLCWFSFGSKPSNSEASEWFRYVPMETMHWKHVRESVVPKIFPKKAGATHHYHDDIWWLITYIYIIIIYYHISPKKDTTFGTSRVIHCWRTAIWCRCFWSLRPCAIAKRRGCVTVKMGSFPVGDRNNQSMFNLGCNNPWCLDVQYRMTINNIAS